MLKSNRVEEPQPRGGKPMLRRILSVNLTNMIRQSSSPLHQLFDPKLWTIRSRMDEWQAGRQAIPNCLQEMIGPSLLYRRRPQYWKNIYLFVRNRLATSTKCQIPTNSINFIRFQHSSRELEIRKFVFNFLKMFVNLLSPISSNNSSPSHRFVMFRWRALPASSCQDLLRPESWRALSS